VIQIRKPDPVRVNKPGTITKKTYNKLLHLMKLMMTAAVPFALAAVPFPLISVTQQSHIKR